MKTPEQYLAEAEVLNDARPWGFLNRRRAALAAIQAAIDDARRPPSSRPPSPAFSSLAHQRPRHPQFSF